MEKGSLLRRSSVSFRSDAEENQITDMNVACAPGPSKYLKSTPGPSEPAKSTPRPSEPVNSTPGPIEPTKFKRKKSRWERRENQ